MKYHTTQQSICVNLKQQLLVHKYAIKYYSENKADISSLYESDSQADFSSQLVFTIARERGEASSGSTSVEKYILVIIRFDEHSLVNDLLTDEAYKAL